MLIKYLLNVNVYLFSRIINLHIIFSKYLLFINNIYFLLIY